MKPARSTGSRFRLASLLFFTAAAVLLTACSGLLGPVEGLQLEDGAAAEDTPDRTNCDEIYGTRFRSQAEREWFEANCSIWPLLKVPDGDPVAPAAPSPQAHLPPECAEMRGKPYSSAEQRQWYLDNCVNRPNVANTQPAGNSSAPGAGDRTNCDEIRGTPYRSENERRWYLANCPSPTPTPPAQPAQPTQPGQPEQPLQQTGPVAQQQAPPPVIIQVGDDDNGDDQPAPRGGPIRIRRR